MHEKTTFKVKKKKEAWVKGYFSFFSTVFCNYKVSTRAILYLAKKKNQKDGRACGVFQCPKMLFHRIVRNIIISPFY